MEIEQKPHEKSQIEFFDPQEKGREEKERTRALINQNKGKLLSLAVAAFYLILGSSFFGGEGFFKTLLFLMLPVPLILFSDTLGNHMGSSWGLGGGIARRIDAPTPAIFLKIMGWFLLLFPIIRAFFV